jgi:hypothetical protein
MWARLRLSRFDYPLRCCKNKTSRARLENVKNPRESGLRRSRSSHWYINRRYRSLELCMFLYVSSSDRANAWSMPARLAMFTVRSQFLFLALCR